MTTAIRHALVVLPLGLIFSGCSDWKESSIRTSSSAPPSAGAPKAYASADNPVPAASEPRPASEQIRLASARETPTPSPAHPRVAFDEFSRLVKDKSALIIDARSPQKFAQGHVRGAINIPSSQKESYTDQFLRGVDPNQPIVIYCGDDSCPASDIVYDYLATQGFTNMRVFPPGWSMLQSSRRLH